MTNDVLTSLGYKHARNCSRIKSRMELPAVQGSSLPESVCGKDERVQVDPMTSPPYKWICSLLIESANGGISRGSGFKIHLPDVDRTAVVTSGHCTYMYEERAYATKITVTFPGQRPVNVGANDIYASPEYINTGDRDHGYGLILLPGTSDDGFGWSAIIPDEKLNNRMVTNCGYPCDKPAGTMWITGGVIASHTANRIYYMNDPMGGQSGSPFYTWYGDYWTVLAIHSYGGCHNFAPRFTREMISRFLKRMNGLKKKTLRSVGFPDVYLRCDGTRVTQWEEAGGGTVNCQYKPPSLWESFYIYPVEMAPSLALQTTYKVVIESAHFRQVFIRMDSQGMKQCMDPGGGEVNCQFTANAWEIYYLRQETNGSYSFRNVHFPHCYIRLDGTRVDSWSKPGGGTVNCQYYDDPSAPALAWECFHLEVH